MKAPELIISKWLNTSEALSLESFKGKVIAIHAFQMLCPGCVLHGIPQAKRLFETFHPDYVSVLGLHTVFEHHDAMTEVSLKAFIHEFRVSFPVAIDKPDLGGRIPKTMELYQMQGTPTWLIIDKNGNLKVHAFGQIDDLKLGSEITKLCMEGVSAKINIYNDPL